jgi:hypothetical protein
MQNVPKIVRERLKAAAPATEHPDANALTAFAERLLPERERAQVFDHLARCGDCRDIVALALPATEPVEVAAKSPARGWLTWPALRWGLVAAGVVAIASLGIVQYQRGVRSENTASRTPPQVEVAAKEAKNEVLAQPAFSADERRDKVQTPPTSAISGTVDTTSATGGAKKSMAREEAAAALPVPPQANREATFSNSGRAAAVGGPLPHGPRPVDQWQQQNAAKNQVPAAPPSPFDKQQAAGDLSANMQVPAVSETVAVEAQSAQQEAKTQNLDAGRLQEQATPQPSGEDYALAKVGKAKPANTPAGATPVSTMATPNSSQMSAGPVLASSAAAPRWTITSTGGLQRSIDQGVSWQPVDVLAKLESSTNAASLQISANNSRDKRKDAQALKRDAAGPLFRAVAANGPEVWAGGSGGVLYHSQDAGDHWTRIVPASAGSSLTGDIVSLEFPDPQHGKVSTSTAEIWITADDGQTWQKQ